MNTAEGIRELYYSCRTQSSADASTTAPNTMNENAPHRRKDGRASRCPCAFKSPPSRGRPDTSARRDQAGALANGYGEEHRGANVPASETAQRREPVCNGATHMRCGTELCVAYVRRIAPFRNGRGDG
ncbi:hypothetical protein MTO96_021811 [Rhipicephalus appendiculatus]